MQRELVLEELKGLIKQIRPAIDLSDVSEQTELVRELGLDSLTVLLLSLGIENKFGFRFNGAPRFNTVGQVIDFVLEQTA
jgi:acyl carrier protein